MVKKTFLSIALLMLVIFAGGCFIVYESFVADSDIDDRFKIKDVESEWRLKLPELNLTTGEAYSFVAFTDTHFEDGKSNGMEKLPDLIRERPEIKFAIVLGDITDGRGKDYEVYVGIAKELAAMGVPFYPVIGNHDVIGNGWDNWKKYIGPTHYRVDAADATLIIMDSANIYFGEEQMDWLQQQLKNTNRDVFIFSHVPLFAPGPLVQIDMRERARMVSILQNKASVVFAGHTHVRHSQKTGGVEYVTVDCYRDSKRYALVNVSSEGKVTYEFKKL